MQLPTPNKTGGIHHTDTQGKPMSMIQVRHPFVRYMLKNVHEACETLQFFKIDLEKATMAATMESKVTLVVTTIRNKIQVTIVLLVCDSVIDNLKGKM